MKQFLEKASKSFELVLFTAARKEYADTIVDRIDPMKRYFHARLYRHHCEQVGGSSIIYPEYYVKNIKSVMNRALRDCIIIDNLIYSFASTMANGILIKPFLMMGQDEELRYLSGILERWKPNTDSKYFIERELNQREFFKHAGLNNHSHWY